MFFKRPKPRVLTFAEHLDNLRAAGFQVQTGPQGTTLVTRNRLGALLREGSDGRRRSSTRALLWATSWRC